MIDMATGQSDVDNSSIVASSSQVTLGSIKLTMKTNLVSMNTSQQRGTGHSYIAHRQIQGKASSLMEATH